MARTTYGKYFRTKKGRYGRYKYINGKRVSFVGGRSVKTTHKSGYKGHRRYGPWKR